MRILIDKETGEEFEARDWDERSVPYNAHTRKMYVTPIPKPEKSLEEEVLEAMQQKEAEEDARQARSNPLYLKPQGTSVVASQIAILCRILDRRLKELKK